MSEQSDAELVRAFQDGDQVAFTRFAARHQDRIFRMAVVWLYDASLAADVLQETLLRSYTGLGRFRFRASPSTWLLRVCRNICHEENRRTARMQSLPADYDAVAEAIEGETNDVPAVLQKVNELAPRQREVVMLRLFEELSVAETARVMGCRPGTVKAHLNKALTALRKLMDRREQPPMVAETYSEVAEQYRRRRAPAAALQAAVANFAARSQQRRQSRWPLLALTAAALCVVVLVQPLLREGEEARPTLASLSLNQVKLPSRPALSLSAAVGSGLAAVTRLRVHPPNLTVGMPNLSQLSLANESVTSDRDKETE